MKNLFIFVSAALLTMTACSDEGSSSKDGEEQVPQPVENSGANTEGERAVEATVNDSTESDERKDTVPRTRRDSIK